MRRSTFIIEIIGFIGVLTGSLVLSCLCGGALQHTPVMPVLITGSLG